MITADDKQHVEAAAKSVEQKFPEAVERIRVNFGKDSTDAPAVFFRVLLKDRSVPNDFLHLQADKIAVSTLSSSIRGTLATEAVAEEDLQPYFLFRTVSEQRKLQDPDWE